MTIIHINDDNVNQQKVYDILDDFFEFGMKYLPFIFLISYTIQGCRVKLPRWLTKRRLDEINRRADITLENIKWE